MHIEDTKTSECPTSLITPSTNWLLEQFHSNRMTVKAGATLYGTDASKWPAWWADAVEALTAEHSRTNAIQGLSE